MGYLDIIDQWWLVDDYSRFFFNFQYIWDYHNPLGESLSTNQFLGDDRDSGWYHPQTVRSKGTTEGFEHCSQLFLF